MSRHRVFVYGSCVSRDTFEHLDPDRFELVQYVARQSALSAYTRPVTLVDPPRLDSPFQQRMVSGDFASSLQTLVPEAAHQTDVVLVDLVDERLGAYVLPDGSVVTRSTELVGSGAEHHLPAGSQHLPFGSEQHYQYWVQGIAAVGALVRQHMPHAAVLLLDVPWAERSEAGAATPSSYGTEAREANALFGRYTAAAAQALDATRVALDPEDVVSSPAHPWGDAPFHYAAGVYRRLADLVVGAVGTRQVLSSERDRRSPATGRLADGPNFLILGAHRSGTAWLQERLNDHDDVFVAPSTAATVLTSAEKIADPAERRAYARVFDGAAKARLRGQRSHLFFWPVADGPFGRGRDDSAAIARDHLPEDTRYLLSLRDPVSRAISAYWQSVAMGAVPPTTSLFAAGSLRGILGVGFYRQLHRHWATTVGEDRISVLLYDDLASDPATYLDAAFDALGLPAAGRPALDAASSSPVNRNTSARLMRSAAPFSPAELQILVELYRPDIEYVESLTGRDLTSWRDVDHLAEINR
ncbi:DUF6270 domain-containing protein [Isoptericola sp. NPDC057191]|uniref:DUF6270 domain-containing protein n=1 Tax=Isoptericola sp. NPDC057191 TaxID=3346041 RepID=UPI00362A95F3